MRRIVVQSNAKINICLDITGQREDGYHTLDMVMVPVALHDTLVIEEYPKAIDNFVTLDDFNCEMSEFNTVTKALDSLKELKPYDNKFKIDMHKVIPMKAGLGGGSSNAAFVLKTINNFVKLGIPEEKLLEVATSIGADVPFFIKNVPARCQGIGDEMTPIRIKNNYYVLIVKPEAGCPTQNVYKLCDKNKNWPHGNVETVIKALEEGDDELLAKSVFNVMEKAAISMVPEIQVIKDKLYELGLKIVLMSGSGSSVFALSTNKKLIKNAMKKLENKYNVIMTTIIK